MDSTGGTVSADHEPKTLLEAIRHYSYLGVVNPQLDADDAR
jgi:hypothetical protein